MELLEFQAELCHATFLLLQAVAAVVADTALAVELVEFHICHRQVCLLVHIL
jgi:hypothetical protein